MKPSSRTASFFVIALLLATAAADAARVRVVHRPHRTRVTVRAGFPLHRTLPHVHVRAPRVAVRVTPRAYLAPVVFRPVVVAVPAPERRAWVGEEALAREEEWTELTMSVDSRGRELLLQVEGGKARVSFAEVVFENGETLVVDFADRSQRRGVYRLADFGERRRVDHVRLVARAASDEATIRLHLLT
jgi:hypothetical protein